MYFAKLLLGCSAIFCAVSQVQAQDQTRGASLFRGRCAACHSVDSRQTSRIGPSLASIANRRAGSQPVFQYSRALSSAKILWSKDNLSRFLASPAKFLPGSRMPISISNEQDRADIVAYMMTLKGP
jgi:cytochrome c